MGHLKGTLERCFQAIFGADTEVRFRPHFFPFTEPSFEIDIKLHVKGKPPKWIEVAGCGMVDPAVFEAVNDSRGDNAFDPEQFTGFRLRHGAGSAGHDQVVDPRHPPADRKRRPLPQSIRLIGLCTTESKIPMLVSLNWLNERIDLSGKSTAELDELLTFAGVEVEGIHLQGPTTDLVVVAEIVEADKHPECRSVVRLSGKYRQRGSAADRLRSAELSGG